MRLVGAGSELLARAAPADELGCYVHTRSRKECSKESDHDCVHITLRGTSIPKPKARVTLRLSTLRHPDMRVAMRTLIAEPEDQDPDVRRG